MIPAFTDLWFRESESVKAGIRFCDSATHRSLIPESHICDSCCHQILWFPLSLILIPAFTDSDSRFHRFWFRFHRFWFPLSQILIPAFTDSDSGITDYDSRIRNQNLWFPLSQISECPLSQILIPLSHILISQSQNPDSAFTDSDSRFHRFWIPRICDCDRFRFPLSQRIQIQCIRDRFWESESVKAESDSVIPGIQNLWMSGFRICECGNQNLSFPHSQISDSAFTDLWFPHYPETVQADSDSAFSRNLNLWKRNHRSVIPLSQILIPAESGIRFRFPLSQILIVGITVSDSGFTDLWLRGIIICDTQILILLNAGIRFCDSGNAQYVKAGFRICESGNQNLWFRFHRFCDCEIRNFESGIRFCDSGIRICESGNHNLWFRESHISDSCSHRSLNAVIRIFESGNQILWFP